MTDKEIIKALKCCVIDDCDVCPNDFGNCYANLAGYALELINRQQEEIDTLTHTLLGVMHSIDKWLDGAELEQDEVNRAATMREKTLRIAKEKQAEIEKIKTKLKYYLETNEENGVVYIPKFIIDNIVKEMVGDNNE